MKPAWFGLVAILMTLGFAAPNRSECGVWSVETRHPATRKPEPLPASRGLSALAPSHSSIAGSGSVPVLRALRALRGETPFHTPSLAAAGERDRPLSHRASERIQEWLSQLGPWAPLALIALFVVACLLCLPVVFLTMASGALFGWWWGFAYAWIAAQMGASLAFWVSRRLAHDWVARRLARRPLLAAVDEVVATEGWRIVGLMRLAPGSPFFLLNYLFGVTRVRYLDYFLATAISIVPGTLFFAYVGSLGHRVIVGRMTTVSQWALHAVGVLALATACVLIARRARRVLQTRFDARNQM